MEASKRVRIVFRDGDILGENLESHGLHRSWVLLKPGQHDTVSDVASYLLDNFQLHQSCPYGLLLSISGFVLPPFESTSILKDDEVISVRKRRQIWSLEGNDASNEVKALKAVEKQPVLLLTNEEFEKEKGGYESDDNEEEVQESLSDGHKKPKHSKRKATKKLKGSKKKKRRSEASEYAANEVKKEKTKKSLGKTKPTSKNRMSSEEKKDDSTEEDGEENNAESAESSEANDVSAAGMKGKKKRRSKASKYAANKVKKEKTKKSLQKTKPTSKNRMSLEEKKDDSTEEDGEESNAQSAESSEANDVSADGIKRKKKRRSGASEYAANKVKKEKTKKSLRKTKPTSKNRVSLEEKKDDSTEEDGEENNAESAESSEANDVSADGMKGIGEENGEENEDSKKAPEGKGPSRSARRKYAKRRWLKEMKNIQKQNMNCESEGLKNWKEDQAKRNEEEGQPRWKQQQADAERIDDGKPKGLLHWMQSPHDDNSAKGKKRGQLNQTYINKHSNQKSDSKQQDQKSAEPKKPTQNNYIPEQPNQMEVDVPEQKIRKNHAEGDPRNSDAAEQPSEEIDDEENEVVPVEISPGHIRFEPLGKEAGKPVQRNHAPSETFQWNGITNKKKGQRWGKENRFFTPQNNVENTSKLYYEISSNEKYKKLDAGVSLDKLPPLTSIPKEGDIIAYRILELSPSWTPELSDFRVGKISWYSAESNQIWLMPMPEYPFCSLDDSLYTEDGSLVTDFSSLIDARIFKNDEPGSGNVKDTSETVVSGSPDLKTNAPRPELHQGKETKHLTSDNNCTDIWDQISEALNTKKEQLFKETNWSKTPTKVQQQPVQENKWEESAKNVKPSPTGNGEKNPQKTQPSQQSSGNKSWSYKALRGSALGPTMAMLRSRMNA